MLSILKEVGIRGQRNGRDMLDKTKYKYYALKAKSYKREVLSLQKNLYDDIDNIEFVYHSEEDILKEVNIEKEHYVHRLNLNIADYGDV